MAYCRKIKKEVGQEKITCRRSIETTFLGEWRQAYEEQLCLPRMPRKVVS